MEKTNELLAGELWQQFTNHIKREWAAKYRLYGASIETVAFPTKFAQAVYAELVSRFAKQPFLVKIPHYLSLHRLFQQGGFPAGAKTGTLDLFARYLGYRHFSDFAAKNRPMPDAPVGFSYPRATGKHGGIDLAEAEKLKTLIEKAAALEFHLYQSAPQHETAMEKLVDFYTFDGPAAQLIKGYLDSAVRNGRQLRVPGSFFEIFSMHCTYLSAETAYVETEEKWRLLWYKTATDQDDMLYDVLNKQLYYLRKTGGEWKIHHNEYAGKIEKIAS